MLLLAILTIPWVAFAVRPGVSSSRRLLAVALVLLVPFAGPVLAWIVRGVRGGKIATEPTAQRKRARPSPEDVRHLGEMPSVVERLLSRDPAERLAALVHLSSVADDDAIATLRWTIEHGHNDVVLEAAMALEEIEMRVTPKRTVAKPVLVRVPSPYKAPSKVLSPVMATFQAQARAA